MAERSNAFADLKTNLADFKPKEKAATKREPVIDRGAIDKLSEEHDFPSRTPQSRGGKSEQPKPRTRRNATGRNQQINIKTTADAIAILYALADKKKVPLGQVFEDGLAALEKSGY